MLHPRSLLAYEQVESLLSNTEACQRYDEAKMHWIGDPDPKKRHDGRQPWVKRIHNHNEYVYSLPVLAAFSIARNSLLSIRKDPWHLDDDRRAWFVGEHHLLTGEVSEPAVLAVSVDAARQLWLQVADSASIDNWPAGRHPAYDAPPYDQRRFQLRLDEHYQAIRAEYRAGLGRPVVEYEDVVGLESMMRVVSQARRLQLPQTVAAIETSQLVRAA